MVRRLVVLLCCLALVACNPRDSVAIRFAVASAATDLDPRYATDATSQRINRLLYARLVDFDPQARPVASLASWQQLGPLHYRFRLGAGGRRFHDGQWLTAADVAATYRSILDPAGASPHSGALAHIGRIEVRDADTLDFFLDREDVLFPARLSIGILPASGIATGQSYHRQPLGSGPFHLYAWHDAGRLELVRTEDQQHILFEQVSDPTMRVLKLLRGEVDLLQNDLPPELLQYLRERPDIMVETRPGNTFSYIGFQMQDKDTGRRDVRRAIALAIDREAIIRYIFRGAARAASAVLPPEHWAGTELPPLRHDPAASRALLASAGYSPEQPLRLTYKTSSDPFRLRIATILQRQLAQAGIEVAVRSYDWGTFYGDIKAGNFQMYSLSWVGEKSPDIFRYAFHSDSLPPRGANRGRFSDARVDDLIDHALTSSAEAEQAQYYAQLQRYLLEELPYVPLWYEDQFFAAADRIAGYRLAVDGSYDALLHTTKQ